MTTDTQKMTNIRSAKGWRPTAGDVLIGTVAHITGTENAYGKYPVVTIAADTEDPESVNYVAVHAFHHDLKRSLVALRPSVGDKLTINYHGEIELPGKFREDGTPQTMHSYTVTGENAAQLWSAF